MGAEAARFSLKDWEALTPELLAAATKYKTNINNTNFKQIIKYLNLNIIHMSLHKAISPFPNPSNAEATFIMPLHKGYHAIS